MATAAVLPLASGTPHCVEMTTDFASSPRVAPNCMLKFTALICLAIPASGPSWERISSGMPLRAASPNLSASGVTTRFHVSIVSSIHCEGPKATELVAPAGRVVASSSHSSASRTDSATACESWDLG